MHGALHTALVSLLVPDHVPREPPLGRHLLPAAKPAPHSPVRPGPAASWPVVQLGRHHTAKVKGGPGPSNTRSETPEQRPTDPPYAGAQMGRGWASVLNT